MTLDFGLYFKRRQPEPIEIFTTRRNVEDGPGDAGKIYFLGGSYTHEQYTMQTTIIDVADFRFSDNPRDILEAPSLGSCVSLIVFDPIINIGGVVVFVLPDSNEIQNPKLDEHPYMFADTAIINFFQMAIEKGIRLEQSKRVLVGGGQVLGQRGDFNLGIRNTQAALDTLSKLELEPTHKHLGGAINRTAALHIKTGMVHISVAGKETEQL